MPAAAAGSTAPKKINVDSKMVGAGDAVAAREGEGKMGHTLQQKGVVNQFSRWIVDRMFNKREMRILMVGLDASGKTSILYRLKLGKPKKTIPTIGFNVETLEYIARNSGAILAQFWRNYLASSSAGTRTSRSPCGTSAVRRLRAVAHYFANTQARGAIRAQFGAICAILAIILSRPSPQALIFVVDSSDARLQEAAEELHRLIHEEELKDALLLVFANKQDLPGACNAAEISEQMRLYPPHISKSCYIQSCCATTGDGLYEGLDWLSSMVGP